MKFRHRYLIITVRVLLGLLLLFSGISGFVMGRTPQGVPESMIPMLHILWDTGIFHMIKVTEIVAGLMLVIGFLPALAAIFVAPLSVGIIIVNAMIAPSSLPLGIIVALFNIYLGYAYWDKYKTLFRR